jgi:crossover junction endodeoxyribonuclease RusA
MLTIELPFPSRELNPNRKSGRHWGETSAAKRAYTHTCWALTLQAMKGGGTVPEEFNIPVKITAHFAMESRMWDADNLLAAMKPGLDGIAAALKVNDNLFDPITISRCYDTREDGRVVVELG